MARVACTFAIVSGDRDAEQDLALICAALEGRTGLTFEPKVVRSSAEMVGAIQGGSVQVAWLSPILAIEGRREGAIVPVLRADRPGGSDYFSALFCRADSNIHSLADLRGARLVWVDPTSAAGYFVPRQKLLRAGINPSDTCASERFLRTHDAVVCAVLDGGADVGATFVRFAADRTTVQSAGWQSLTDLEGTIRILLVSGPIRSDVIVIATAVDPENTARITDALRSLSAMPEVRDALQRVFAATGFLPVDPDERDDVLAPGLRARE